jgi:hypothetical protein
VGGGDCEEGHGGIGWRVLVLRQVIEMIGEGEGGVDVGGLELVGNEECRPRHRDGMGWFICVDKVGWHHRDSCRVQIHVVSFTSSPIVTHRSNDPGPLWS